MKYKYFIKILISIVLLVMLGVINGFFLYYIPFIIIHELTHCFIARLLGYSINSIKMLPFGISASFNEEFINPLDDILISISGPLINFIFFVIFSMLSQNNTYFLILSQSNLILAIFNLIPGGFLDGGRILKNLLKIYISFYSAYSINNINGIILGCLLVFISLFLPITLKNVIGIFMGTYFIYTGYSSQKQIIISIIEDSLNKVVYLKKIRKVNCIINFKKDYKIIDVIKCFNFKKYYIIYIYIDDMSWEIFDEEEILKAYLSFGNIMLREISKLST
ncbi:MAG: peptidase [Clostridiales bacterium]|jgi:stage IV sporulation protein FB|nr:peptidase [Clostridiales bacterium]